MELLKDFFKVRIDQQTDLPNLFVFFVETVVYSNKEDPIGWGGGFLIQGSIYQEKN